MLVSLPFLAAAVFGVTRAGADERPPAQYRKGGVEIGPLPPKDRGPTDDVRTVYLRDCATCHGGDARGTPRGPSLVGVGRASVYYWVSTGRLPLHDDTQRVGRRPPAYPPDVVQRLVGYVAMLAGGGGPDVPALAP